MKTKLISRNKRRLSALLREGKKHGFSLRAYVEMIRTTGAPEGYHRAARRNMVELDWTTAEHVGVFLSVRMRRKNTKKLLPMYHAFTRKDEVPEEYQYLWPNESDDSSPG